MKTFLIFAGISVVVIGILIWVSKKASNIAISFMEGIDELLW